MTVLETPTVAGMTENLWLDKACSVLIPDLPIWIIEYAWTKRMMEVLEVLGPPLWLEGDWHLLNLEEPFRIRVVAAEVWKIMQTRDIQHFERIIEFVDVTYTLVPRLVTPIKHMKIKFGLQTLVIIWMLWNEQSVAEISEKIENFFSNSLSQYQKCSRKHMDLMQKNQKDFTSFAQVLAGDREMRETYIRDLLEEQYGECYAQKLEERISHYLGELDKVLPQSTYIEQVLEQPYSYERGEKILKKILAKDSASVATALKRLLRCAVTTNLGLDGITTPSTSNSCEEQRDAVVSKPSTAALHVILRPSQNNPTVDRPSQTSSKELFSSQSLWQNRNTGSTLPQEEICDDEAVVTSTQLSDSEIDQTEISQSLLKEKEPVRRHKPGQSQSEAKEKEAEPDFTEQMCSKHGKKMKSILQECSEEPDGEAIQAECTPTSTQSTPPLFPLTPQPQASPNQHLLSSHQDSSSTNISMSYIQRVSTSPVSSTKPAAPLSPVDQHCSSSSSSQSTALKQLCTQRTNAGAILATIVVTEPNKTNRSKLKLSLESQSILMQSSWLQPQVCLKRLCKKDCARTMASARAHVILEGEPETGDDQYISFDVNTLYSDSEDSDSTIFDDSDDPDYEPNGD